MSKQKRVWIVSKYVVTDNLLGEKEIHGSYIQTPSGELPPIRVVESHWKDVTGTHIGLCSSNLDAARRGEYEYIEFYHHEQGAHDMSWGRVHLPKGYRAFFKDGGLHIEKEVKRG